MNNNKTKYSKEQCEQFCKELIEYDKMGKNIVCLAHSFNEASERWDQDMALKIAYGTTLSFGLSDLEKKFNKMFIDRISRLYENEENIIDVIKEIYQKYIDEQKLLSYNLINK